MNIVYIQLISGKVIPFNVSDDFTFLQLRSNLDQYLKDEDMKNGIYFDDTKDDKGDDKDNEERILFFDKNYEKLDWDKKVISGSIYYAFINDFIVNISFDRTIYLNHNYTNIPRKAILNISESMTSMSYYYIYKELEYLNADEEYHMYGRDFIYNYEYDPSKFENMLKRYNLLHIKDIKYKDFDMIDEQTKITLITAYLRECLSISMIIDGYTFL